MTTPQPSKLRPSSPSRYEEISRHLLNQAEEELNRGDVLQASEKLWLSVSHQLKAVAQDRGWNHRYHNHLSAIVSYLSLERNRPDWVVTFGAFDSMHSNAYEHQRHDSDIRPYLGVAETYCAELAQTILTAAPPVTLSAVQQRDQATHLRTLTRPLRQEVAFGPQLTPEEEANLPPVSPIQP